MFSITGPRLVIEAAKSGVMVGLPRANALSYEEFAAWLSIISDELDEHRTLSRGARIGPVAVNLPRRLDAAELNRHLALCTEHGIKHFISAQGNPTEMTKRVHDAGGRIFHDVTTMRHAEKAISAGVDGLTAIGAGGGGHSGLLNLMVFVPRLRRMYDGVILAAGGIATGSAIRAVQSLGADLAYIGTRFIATQESMAPPAYKRMIVESTSSDLRYTDGVNGIPANWLAASLAQAGVDPEHQRAGRSQPGPEPLPDGLRPWRDIWSAGQGVDLINDIPTVSQLVLRLRTEYMEPIDHRKMEAY